MRCNWTWAVFSSVIIPVDLMSKWLQHTVLEQPAEKASTISPHYHVPWQNIPSDSAKCMVIVACQTACNVRKRQLKCTYLWYGALKMTFISVTVNVLRRDQKRSTETALRVQRRNLVSNSNTTPMVRWSFMHSSVDCVGLRMTLAGRWLWKGFARMTWMMPGSHVDSHIVNKVVFR